MSANQYYQNQNQDQFAPSYYQNQGGPGVPAQAPGAPYNSYPNGNGFQGDGQKGYPPQGGQMFDPNQQAPPPQFNQYVPNQGMNPNPNGYAPNVQQPYADSYAQQQNQRNNGDGDRGVASTAGCLGLGALCCCCAECCAIEECLECCF